MDFLGFDIYLVIVVVAAIMVGSVMWVMAKTIGRKPDSKKRLKIPDKKKKPGAVKPKPALKAPAGKPGGPARVTPKVAPAVKPVLKKKAVVPVAVGASDAVEDVDENEQTQDDASFLESVKQAGMPTIKPAKSAGNKETPEEEPDFDMSMPPDNAEAADQIVGENPADQPVDEAEEDLPEEQGEWPDPSLGGGAEAPKSQADLASLDQKESEDEPKKDGGLLDLFEEEDDDDSSSAMLASKLDDVDGKSLEEIGKEISQSLFNKY
jgi:hypothetical protein